MTLSENESNQLAFLFSRPMKRGGDLELQSTRAVAEDLAGNTRPFNAGPNYLLAGRDVQSKSALRHENKKEVTPLEALDDIPANCVVWRILNQVRATKSGDNSTPTHDWCTGARRLSKF